MSFMDSCNIENLLDYVTILRKYNLYGEMIGDVICYYKFKDVYISVQRLNEFKDVYIYIYIHAYIL